MIVIGCPIRNRAWILSRYLEAIYNLDYSKKDIILCFLINDCEDDSWLTLISSTFLQGNFYKDVIIKVKNYGFESCERELGRNTEKFLHFAKVRNDWISSFEKINDVSHVFSIDSDVLVPADSLKKLIADDKDICSMVINNSKKSWGKGKDITNLFDFNSNYEQYLNVLQYPQNTQFEIAVTGSAYLIKRKVLDDVDYQAHPMGEDFGFCIKAKQFGYKVWCDSTIVGKHIMNKEEAKNG